ncbi:MAG TPA: hemerythrin domain-containing protein [Burkholderiales bacterium]|nr:hemerythrin domain-containing protein [Burkholderiales bacterium]
MDAVDLLLQQHQEMERLLRRALEVEEPEERKRRFTRIADLLTVHMESEEQVFYPAVKANRTEDILLESLEEHLSLKRLVADLLPLDGGDQTFEPKFKVLKEQAEHHHKEEEENLFPKVKKLLDSDTRDALGDEMCALQRRLAREGEPRELAAEQTDAAAPLK